MKKIVTIIATLVLFNNLVFGQDKQDSITIINISDSAFLGSLKGSFFTGKTSGYFIRQYPQDTLKVLMVICDTTDTGTERFPYQNHNVYWIQGYFVRDVYNFNGEPMYLDTYKRRLPHGIVVMYVKSLD